MGRNGTLLAHCPTSRRAPRQGRGSRRPGRTAHPAASRGCGRSTTTARRRSGRPLPGPPRCCKSTWEWSGHMSTCTRSRRDEGMSAFGEVRRPAIEHGAPWSRMRGRRGRPPTPLQSRTGPGPPSAHAASRRAGWLGPHPAPRSDLHGCPAGRSAIRSATRGRRPARRRHFGEVPFGTADARPSHELNSRRPPSSRGGGDLTSHPSPDLRRSGTYLRSPSGPGACIKRRRGSRWHTPSGQGT